MMRQDFHLRRYLLNLEHRSFVFGKLLVEYRVLLAALILRQLLAL